MLENLFWCAESVLAPSSGDNTGGKNETAPNYNLFYSPYISICMDYKQFSSVNILNYKSGTTRPN